MKSDSQLSSHRYNENQVLLILFFQNPDLLAAHETMGRGLVFYAHQGHFYTIPSTQDTQQDILIYNEYESRTLIDETNGLIASLS